MTGCGAVANIRPTREGVIAAGVMAGILTGGAAGAWVAGALGSGLLGTLAGAGAGGAVSSVTTTATNDVFRGEASSPETYAKNAAIGFATGVATVGLARAVTWMRSAFGRGAEPAADGLQPIADAELAAARGGGAGGTGQVEANFLRAVPQDQVGTSQAFKLRAGERGLSVFEGVTSAQVLKELPGVRVPNACVGIPCSGLPPGTSVAATPAPGLSPALSAAHRELIPPPGMSTNAFAKALKALVGW